MPFPLFFNFNFIFSSFHMPLHHSFRTFSCIRVFAYGFGPPHIYVTNASVLFKPPLFAHSNWSFTNWSRALLPSGVWFEICSVISSLSASATHPCSPLGSTASSLPLKVHTQCRYVPNDNASCIDHHISSARGPKLPRDSPAVSAHSGHEFREALLSWRQAERFMYQYRRSSMVPYF